MTLRDPIEREAARLRGEKLRDCPKDPGAPCGVVARTELLGAARDALAERARQGCRNGTGADCARLARENEKIKPPDLALIADLRRTGCDKGDGESCTALASIYAEGRGVPKDERRALAMFDQAYGDTEATLSGCDDGGAECELMRHLATAARPQVEGARAQLAPALISDECNAGRIASCSALVEYYAAGSNADAAKAATFAQRTRTLLDNACRSGDKHACESIAANDAFAPGAGKNRGRAFYDQECRSRDFKACWSLADSYRLESRSVTPPPAATDAYRRGVALADPACTAGNREACHLMLAAYTGGLGVQKDEERAMHYATRLTDLMRAKR
jgi:TPR repeat protein